MKKFIKIKFRKINSLVWDLFANHREKTEVKPLKNSSCQTHFLFTVIRRQLTFSSLRKKTNPFKASSNVCLIETHKRSAV